MALTIADCDADTCCDYHAPAPTPPEPEATCETFKGCKGKSSEYADKILEKITPYPACTGDASTCNIETCCEAVTAEDSCFPGEAEVSVQSRFKVRVDQLGTQVLTEGGLEAVVGMLHLHSEVSPAFAQATAVSV